jgi:hypothetical protein
MICARPQSSLQIAFRDRARAESGRPAFIPFDRCAVDTESPRAHIRKIPKLFLLVFNADLAAADEPQLRGSFLPPNSNAGGNRARGR